MWPLALERGGLWEDMAPSFIFFSVHKDDWPGKGNLGSSVISCDKIR